MKTLAKDQNNKWFLTVALLGALVLNSGLWQIKQSQMKSSDFSSTETDPSKIYEDLKAKKKTADEKVAPLKLEFEKAKSEYDKGAADKTMLASKVAELKILMEEKEKAFKTAQEEQKVAVQNVTSFEENLRKITTAAGVALPGVKCETEECKRTQALTDQVAALTKQIEDAKKAKEEVKEKAKTADEVERERTKEELDRVVRICRDSEDEKALKCLTQELVDMLERNKGDKKLVKDLVLRFYRDKIEEQLRTDMMSSQSRTVNSAIAAMGRFERSLPSEYNYLREEVIDTARQAGKQLAVNSQDYLKAAEQVKLTDPQLSEYYRNLAGHSRDIFIASTSNIDRSLLTNLSAARRDKLVTESWMQNNYVRDWYEPINQIRRGMYTNPRGLKIADEDDYVMEHLYESALTRGLNLGSNIAAGGGRRSGRNSGTRLDTINESIRVGDTINADVSFGKLGTTSGRTRSGRTGRSN